MNAYADRDWREDVRDILIAEVAEALGFDSTSGQGERRRFRLAHNGCDGIHSDGQPAVYIARKANRLKCRRCGEGMGGVDLVALALGLNPDPRRLDGDAWERIRDLAASHRWCLPEPRKLSPDQEMVWRQEREQRARERLLEASRREAERRSGAIDVHRAWNALAEGRIGRDLVMGWARARGIPEALLPHLPWSDLAAIPNECPAKPCGTRPEDWQEAVRLMRAGYAVDRRILIAQRDAEGRPVGASRRWHRADAPTDGRAKALALSTEQALEGSPTSWPGGVAIFGDLPVAVARARKGELLVLIEGGPDWLIASAALRRLQRGSALGAPGVASMPKIASALRAGLWSGPPLACRPRVVIVPDAGAVAEAAAWQSAEELHAMAEVSIRRTGADDLNALVKTRGLTAEAVGDFLMGGTHG